MKQLFFIVFFFLLLHGQVDAQVAERINNGTPLTFSTQGQSQSYFDITLVECGIAKKARLWKKYTPVLRFDLDHGNKSLQRLIGDFSGNDNNKISNKLLTYRIPYNNNSVNFKIKLYAIKKEDMANDILSAANEAIAVPALALSAYAPYIQAVQSCFQIVDKYFIKNKYEPIPLDISFDAPGPGALRNFTTGQWVVYNPKGFVIKKDKVKFDINNVLFDTNGNAIYNLGNGKKMLLSDSDLDYAIINIKKSESRLQEDFSAFKFFAVHAESKKRVLAIGSYDSSVQESYLLSKQLLILETDQFTAFDMRKIAAEMEAELRDLARPTTIVAQNENNKTLDSLRSALVITKLHTEVAGNVVDLKDNIKKMTPNEAEVIYNSLKGVTVIKTFVDKEKGVSVSDKILSILDQAVINIDPSEAEKFLDERMDNK